MALYSPHMGDRTIGPFQLQRKRTPLFRGAGECESYSADVGDYETGRPPADQSPRWRARPPAGWRGGDKTRIIEPSEALPLSPEPGAMPPIVVAVPERIYEHHIGRGERVSGRATLAQAGRTPPGRSPGRSPARSRGRSPGKWPGRSPGKWPGRSPGKWPGRWPGRSRGRWPGRWPGRSPGRWPGRSPGRWPGRSPGGGGRGGRRRGWPRSG